MRRGRLQTNDFVLFALIADFDHSAIGAPWRKNPHVLTVGAVFICFIIRKRCVRHENTANAATHALLQHISDMMYSASL
jgi:hypothetical protein